MSKGQKVTAGGTSTFYKTVNDAKEIRSGYLNKSPPQRGMPERSWKKRYFVLFKVNDEEHHLKYFRSPEEMDRPLGEIDLMHITLLYVNPQNHPKWCWIQRNFKCSGSHVLYIKSGNRDYFLVGETSEEMEGWFNNLHDALKNKPHRFHSTEEIHNGKSIKMISRPILSRSASVSTGDKSPKLRSLSDPPSKTMERIVDKDDELSRRRASAPVPHYAIPRLFLDQNPIGNETVDSRMESMYETMMEIKEKPTTAQLDQEVEEANGSTIMQSVTDVFNNLRKQISPLTVFPDEKPSNGRENNRHSSEFSSGSSDNGANSPVELVDKRSSFKPDKQNSTESLDHTAPMERDIQVKLADMKKHLSLTEVEGRPSLDHTVPVERDFLVKLADLKKHLSLIEVEGKPSVSGWTGQPQTVCLFHKGDQILAINDMHAQNLKEVNMYLNRSLKNEVKVNILRLPGSLPLHSPSYTCHDFV